MANNIKTKTTIKSLKDLGSNSQDKHIKRNEMMRNILWDLILYLDANEKIIDNTFPSGHKIITARVEKRSHKFLYKNSEDYHFMDNSSYEQIVLKKEQIDFLLVS